MSDYVDENFEIDETDEYWGLNKQEFRNFDPNTNDIIKINEKCHYLKNDNVLRQQAKYKYVEPYDGFNNYVQEDINRFENKQDND